MALFGCCYCIVFERWFEVEMNFVGDVCITMLLMLLVGWLALLAAFESCMLLLLESGLSKLLPLPVFDWTKVALLRLLAPCFLL